ncbi:MAG: ATP-binding protein [bacterium]
MKIKLENRMIISFCLLVVIAIAASMAASFVLLNRGMQENLSREIETAIRAEETAVHDREERARLAVRILAEDAAVKKLTAQRNTTALYSNLLNISDQMRADLISVLDADGVILAQYGTSDAHRNPAAATPLFLDQVFQQVVNDRITAAGLDLCSPDSICIQAISPVKNGDETIGYVRVAYKLDDRFARDLKNLTGADLFLFKQRRLLATSLRSKSLPTSEVDNLAGILHKKITAEQEPQPFPLRISLQGTPYIFQASPVGKSYGTPFAWKLTGRTTAEVIRSWQRALITLTILTLIILPLSIAAGVFTYRRIARPLKTLMNGVEQITGGNLNAAIHLPQQDEIGDLAGAFNEMTHALKDREQKLREAAEELRRNQDQLIQSGKLAAIGELAAGVAHEIGNPLSAIYGYAQMLKKNPHDEETRRQYLAEIEKEADFIEKIIRDLLNFSRPAPQVSEEVDIKQILETALRTASALPQFQLIQTVRNFQPVPFFTGNPKELVQLFLNLIMNAVQAMPKGGTLTLNVSHNSAAREIEIGVEDTGAGIPPEIRDRIFDPFFTTKPPGQGTGLGLSICFRIVEKHGGRLEVESETNKGSRFKVFLSLPSAKKD